uniref:Uncharacterized protein n=1 Tax=Setaria italica TaxID=4555 RepID=K4AK39_SETIT
MACLVLLPSLIAEDGQKKLAVEQTSSSPVRVGHQKDPKMLVPFCFSCHLENCPTRKCKEFCDCSR